MDKINEFEADQIRARFSYYQDKGEQYTKKPDHSAWWIPGKIILLLIQYALYLEHKIKVMQIPNYPYGESE